MPDDVKVFLDSDYILLAAKMVRRIVYRHLSKLIAVFEYEEQWRKLSPYAICEIKRAEVSEFLFCLELKKEIDNCSILNDSEQNITAKANLWFNKLLEGH